VDEIGMPVHESCQALKLSLKNEAASPRKSSNKALQRPKAC
jgi:hypothetical protein